MNKFTPGPWEITEELESRFVLNNGDFDIWCTDGVGNSTSKEEAKANAMLIASAPDMIKVLLDILNDDISNGILKGRDRVALKKVISKATGGDSIG